MCILHVWPLAVLHEGHCIHDGYWSRCRCTGTCTLYKHQVPAMHTLYKYSTRYCTRVPRPTSHTNSRYGTVVPYSEHRSSRSTRYQYVDTVLVSYDATLHTIIQYICFHRASRRYSTCSQYEQHTLVEVRRPTAKFPFFTVI